MTELVSKHYYHGITRRVVIGFGDLFSHIEVVRYNEDGSENNRASVPIYYGPKEKWAVRIEQDADMTQRPRAILLPRMAYEITGYTYDANRKQPMNLGMKHAIESVTPGSNDKMYHTYTPAPYDIDFNLYVIAKSVDEASQVIEQILPFFVPDYTMVLNLVDSMKMKLKVPVYLRSVSCEDSWDGGFNERRQIIWTLAFTAKTTFYGPVREKPIVRNAITTINDFDTKVNVDVQVETVLNTDPTTSNTQPDAVNLDLRRTALKDFF